MLVEIRVANINRLRRTIIPKKQTENKRQKRTEKAYKGIWIGKEREAKKDRESP